MKTIIELDKNDIAKIIAQHFDVKYTDVDVHPFITTKGYGMDEHDEADILIKITQTTNMIKE